MSNTNIENSICEAINIIVSKKLAEAKYDRTINANIISLDNRETGEYTVKYEDLYFKAYAINIESTFNENDMVRVLIPENDWQNQKLILR